MTSLKILHKVLYMTLLLWFLVSCGAPVERVDEGGFSFRPVASFGVEVESFEATMANQDEKIRFVLGGRSACEIKSLEGILEGFLGRFTQGRGEWEAAEPPPIITPGLREWEVGKPHPIIIAGQEGLAVDLTGTLAEDINGATHLYKITGRLALVAPTDSQLFYVFATAKGGHWEAEGKEVFNAVMESIDFFEPTNTSHAFPCFVDDTPQEVIEVEEFLVETIAKRQAMNPIVARVESLFRDVWPKTLIRAWQYQQGQILEVHIRVRDAGPPYHPDWDPGFELYFTINTATRTEASAIVCAISRPREPDPYGLWFYARCDEWKLVKSADHWTVTSRTPFSQEGLAD
jgi:hypothetical protein